LIRWMVSVPAMLIVDHTIRAATAILHAIEAASFPGMVLVD
jgi:hypothetical protein